MDYKELISIENIFQAWNEFIKGKRKRLDVQLFQRHLEDNLFSLHQLLKTKTYRHGDYHSFYVHDPKERHIHKASVRDRVVHHLLYQYLYGVFNKTFIYDCYSCRLNKGTHKAVARLEKFTRKVSQNYSRPCWALKCDIRKFFASIDHQILLKLLKRKIVDEDIIWLVTQVINSFDSEFGRGKGIPLGNLTSQVFANIYLDELDKYIKHRFRVKYYLRYVDDFLLLSENKEFLNKYIQLLSEFLQENLRLELHPKKVIFKKLDWGIDFLGYIVLPHYRLPRTKTKRRIFEEVRINTNKLNLNQALQSYLGYLGHANAYKLGQELRNQMWLWMS